MGLVAKHTFLEGVGTGRARARVFSPVGALLIGSGKWGLAFFSSEEGASGHHAPLAVWGAKWSSSLVYKPGLLINLTPSQDCTQLSAAEQERSLLIEKSISLLKSLRLHL